jgi:hypothetical protein
MNLAVLKTVGGPKVQRAALTVQKFAPEILTGVGILGVISSTFMIAKVTTKLEPIIEDHAADVHVAKMEDPDDKKAIVKVYVHTGLKVGKLYGPAVSLELASILSILAAHGIMQRRTVALMGAYKAVESAFAGYRSRVIEEFGEEKDRDYRTGVRTESITDAETGKKKKVKKFDGVTASPYAKVFDESNEYWRPFPEFNVNFLKNQQNYFNDMLRSRGHVFLNEVYDALGFERTHAGQIVGWAITMDGGDNYVDFGVFGADTESAHRLVNGDEASVWLDFNVDGVIIDLI